jgi:hypothetical protein
MLKTFSKMRVGKFAIELSLEIWTGDIMGAPVLRKKMRAEIHD